MTLHVHYDHQCPNCNAYYIPYDMDVPCPCCGLVELDRFDFISQAVASARFNFKTKGSYVPTAWFAGSLADHILWLLFGLLEKQRKEPDGQSFNGMAYRLLGHMDWGNQGYLRDHVCAIAVRVYERLNIN